MTIAELTFRRSPTKSFPIAMIAASLLLWSSPVHATEPANPHVPLQKTIGQPLHQAPLPTLGVLNSDGAMLEGSKLTLTGVAGNVIVFADRPVHAAGHETVELFISRWAEGKDSFSVDPPNSTVSVLGGEKDGVTDAVVVLKNPKLADGSLTFEVDVLEGDLKGVKGPARLTASTQFTVAASTSATGLTARRTMTGCSLPVRLRGAAAAEAWWQSMLPA